MRKTSHNNNSSVGQKGVFQRLRNGTGANSSSATATSRYSTGAINTNAHKRIE